MIVTRYLGKQILLTTIAITLVLLLVVVSGRLAAYISEAADGRLAATLVFPVVFFRLPQFLELILPVSLLLGVMIGLGQLYENNEMTVLSATGTSHLQILKIAMIAAGMIAFVVAMFSLFLAPKGYQYVNGLIEAQGLKSDLGTLAPGVFYELKDGGGTFYAGEVSSDRNSMEDVFVYRPQLDDETVPTVIHAAKGYQEYDENGAFYFVLEDGIRYEGIAGEPSFTVTKFDRYRQRIDEPESAIAKSSSGALETSSMAELLARSDSEAQAEIHWRLSLPVMTLLLAALAVPLSRSNPRQGRYFKLIPGMIFYLVYVVVVNAGRESVGDGKVSPLIGIWLFHGCVLLLALVLFNAHRLRGVFSRRQKIEPTISALESDAPSRVAE